MRAVLMSSVIGAMTLTAAIAQAEPTTREEVKVPFAFYGNGYGNVGGDPTPCERTKTNRMRC